MEHPHIPPCQEDALVSTEPPQRGSVLPREEVGTLASAQWGAGSSPTWSLGGPRLTASGCTFMEWVKPHPGAAGPSPESSVGSLPSQVGHPYGTDGMLLGAPPQGRGSPRRASRNAFTDEGNTARHGWEDSREGKRAPAEKVGGSQESRWEGPKACWEHPTEQVTSQALPQNFQNVLSTSVHHPVSSSMSQGGRAGGLR